MNNLPLTKKLREDLNRQYGKLVSSNNLISMLPKNATVYAVGDQTVLSLIKHGYKPKIAIIDHRTKRRKVSRAMIRELNVLKNLKKVDNPAGTITSELILEVKNAVKRKTPTTILVNGEEDLATLLCAHYGRINAMLIYGLPGRGMDLIKIDKSTKYKSDYFIKTLGLKL